MNEKLCETIRRTTNQFLIFAGVALVVSAALVIIINVSTPWLIVICLGLVWGILFCLNYDDVRCGRG